MKKGIFLPAAALILILVCSLWNGHIIKTNTTRWQDQLRQADALMQSDGWTAAIGALNASYQDWSGHQTYLHIVSEHDAVDDAEAMYQRLIAFASARETSEFRAETADLVDQLRLLAETERLSVKNIL